MKAIACALLCCLCSCETAIQDSDPGFEPADLQGACNDLVDGARSVRDRCGVMLPDASDDCLSWPRSETLTIARCGWHLESASCDTIESVRELYCSCLSWLDSE